MMRNGAVPAPHLLIADDDIDQLRLLVTALRNVPYRVSVAQHGDQAYARAAVLLPDLILLDVRMPGRSGLTVARLLKANPLTRPIPILFLSGLVDAQERLEGLRAGGADYICKPFYVDEVLERVRIHLALAATKTARAATQTSTEATVAASPTITAPENTAMPPAPQDEHPPALLAHAATRQVALQYILEHIQAPALKSTDVAASMGLSIRRLNAVFEACDGVSVFEFIRRERMRRAMLMLGQSNLGISDIAIEVGYESPANFSTEFKKFWGQSPSQLRGAVQTDATMLQTLIATRLA